MLPEVKLEGILGGSITIECPRPETPMRLYLCREMAKSGSCVTVISNNHFVRKEYKHRVTLELCPDENLFLVKVTELTKNDSGVYACGVGQHTDRGKTQQVTLDIHSDANDLLVPDACTCQFFRIHIQRASSVVAAKPTTPLPSTTVSKTSAPERLHRPQTASYNQHTRLHRQRGFNHGPASQMEDQGFHMLIPIILGLILLALLGLLVKRVIQKRKESPEYSDPGALDEWAWVWGTRKGDEWSGNEDEEESVLGP
ncbi:Fas apoptotic inhibitory molecule 3 [Pteropus alecto]|uniref:Fas apoptotic inhibitory molecule 3 n=1 Tax=Pteropus alecto TaxID=9402 RepID=L5JYH0_PTEAL|nr:Fas apoptotic inhibitory molecule 3 [Pteropus alecto]